MIRHRLFELLEQAARQAQADGQLPATALPESTLDHPQNPEPLRKVRDHGYQRGEKGRGMVHYAGIPLFKSIFLAFLLVSPATPSVLVVGASMLVEIPVNSQIFSDQDRFSLSISIVLDAAEICMADCPVNFDNK